jgi:hypothetical protein
MMEKYHEQKSSVKTMHDDEEYIASPLEGKAEQVNLLSGSWFRSLLLTVETRGIQRVTEEERQANTSKVWNACTFW